MQYFVSIENTNYFYWQVELLIESFKMHGLQDQLVIGIAENETPKRAGIAKNLLSHPNKFMHENSAVPYGLSSNQIQGVAAALANKYLSCPFTLIHADMVLVKPVKEIEGDIVISPYEFHLQSVVDPYLSEIAKVKEAKVDDFPKTIPVGGVMVFNKDVPADFFAQVQSRMRTLAKESPNEDKAKAAWALGIYDFLGLLQLSQAYLETHLLAAKTENFVHYAHGIPPVFNKRYYKGDLCLTNNPYEVMLDHNPTPCTDYLHKVIHAYRNDGS